MGLIATGFGSSPRWVAERDDRDHRDNRDGLVGVVGGGKRCLMARLPLDLATLQDEWQSETTETTETTVTGLGGDSWVTFGLFQERLCDVSVVLVVSVVSFWHWIRSVVCQLSEPGAAVIGTGYEVLCASCGPQSPTVNFS